MASPVVFKIRVFNPNYHATASKNRSHIYYIAKRLGVSLNSGMAHGLFGKLGGHDFGDIKDIKSAADYVFQKTKDKTNVYRGIVSLAEADAMRLGYENKKDWESMIQTHIYDIADKAGVPPSRLEYCAAVHLDKGHPHVHYLFWDKEQGIKKAWIAPKLANEIRIDLTKKIFKDELAELHQLKNEAREVLTSNAGDFFKCFFEPYANMPEDEYKKARERLMANPDFASGELMNMRIPPELLADFTEKVFAFREKLPKTGRLNFKFLPPKLKMELEDIIQELVYYNDDFSREYERYADVSVEIASHYTKDPKALAAAREKAEDEITRRLCNRLLKNIKQLDRKEYDNQKNAQFQKTEAIRILTDLFSFLSRENESRSRGANVGSQRRELSKQAKKELAIKKESSSSIDWGNDEWES